MGATISLGTVYRETSAPPRSSAPRPTLSLGARYHVALSASPAFRAALARAVETNHPILAALVAELTAAVKAGRPPSLLKAWELHDEVEEEENDGLLCGTLHYNVSPDKIRYAFRKANERKAIRQKTLMSKRETVALPVSIPLNA